MYIEPHCGHTADTMLHEDVSKVGCRSVAVVGREAGVEDHIFNLVVSQETGNDGAVSKASLWELQA